MGIRMAFGCDGVRLQAAANGDHGRRQVGGLVRRHPGDRARHLVGIGRAPQVAPFAGTAEAPGGRVDVDDHAALAASAIASAFRSRRQSGIL